MHSGCSFAFTLSVLHLERHIAWRMLLCFPCISVTPRASHCMADAPLLSLYQCYTKSVTLPGGCSFAFPVSVLHQERYIAWRMLLSFPCISVTPIASLRAICSFAFLVSVLHLERHIAWRMLLCFPYISVTPRASHCLADAPLLSLYQCYT